MKPKMTSDDLSNDLTEEGFGAFEENASVFHLENLSKMTMQLTILARQSVYNHKMLLPYSIITTNISH